MQTLRNVSPRGEEGTGWAEHRRNLRDRRLYANGLYAGPPVHVGPVKEEAGCACSEKDELGRARYVGFCPDVDCERRPR